MDEIMEQLQLIVGMMENLSTKEDLHEMEVRINSKIENEITERLDSLTDGYKLNHEKQWELERYCEQLQSQIDDLQARLAALENKIA